MLGLLGSAILIGVLAIVSISAASALAKAKISKALMEIPTLYEARTTDYAKTLLVLGDSTGVGVGADAPEDTVAAKLAVYLGATYVENQSFSGAEVEDLSTQIQRLHLTHYDFILIQIGGNDVLALHSARKTAGQLSKILDTLPDAGKVVVMSVGNVGGATMFPWVVRALHTAASLALHKEFTKVIGAREMQYVNLYRPPLEDPFILHPWKYLAADGLHPSSEGYAVWFEQLKTALEAK